MIEWDDFAKLDIRGRSFALLVFTFACGPASSAPAPEPRTIQRHVVVAHVTEVAAASDAVVSRDVVVTDRTTARIMRVPPAGTIAEHHHPHFEEVLFVHAGHVTLSLDNVEYALENGAVVFIPPGTVITGRNPGRDEAVLLISWSRVSEGPLTVPGRAH